MRINSVNSVYVQRNNATKMSTKNQQQVNQNSEAVSFRGPRGAITGAFLGVTASTFGVLLAPVAIVTTCAAALAVNLGAAVVGGAIGDKVADKIEDQFKK